ncbi:MAG: hypothetical protein ACYC9Z_13750 [Casimicrobiaceae bacterium]
MSTSLESGNAHAGLFGYSNVWDCVLDKMPGVQSDAVAAAVYIECQRKAPETRVMNKSTRMRPYECVAKFGRNTGGTQAPALITAACFNIYEHQSTTGQKSHDLPKAPPLSGAEQLTLVCNAMEQGKPDNRFDGTFVVNMARHTVDGMPAIITEHEIRWGVEDNVSGPMTFRIDRYSGDFYFTSGSDARGDAFEVVGKCVPATRRQF